MLKLEPQTQLRQPHGLRRMSLPRRKARAARRKVVLGTTTTTCRLPRLGRRRRILHGPYCLRRSSLALCCVTSFAFRPGGNLVTLLLFMQDSR